MSIPAAIPAANLGYQLIFLVENSCKRLRNLLPAKMKNKKYIIYSERTRRSRMFIIHRRRRRRPITYSIESSNVVSKKHQWHHLKNLCSENRLARFLAAAAILSLSVSGIQLVWRLQPNAKVFIYQRMHSCHRTSQEFHQVP